VVENNNDEDTSNDGDGDDFDADKDVEDGDDVEDGTDVGDGDDVDNANDKEEDNVIVTTMAPVLVTKMLTSDDVRGRSGARNQHTFMCLQVHSCVWVCAYERMCVCILSVYLPVIHLFIYLSTCCHTCTYIYTFDTRMYERDQSSAVR
jgi:hypothetical protein